MMSNSELLVLQDLVAQINQTAGYSYEVLVQGTVVQGIVYLFATLLWLAVLILAARHFWKWGMSIVEKDDDSDAPIYALAAIFVIGVASAVLFDMIATFIMMIANPQYVVISDIVKGVV